MSSIMHIPGSELVAVIAEFARVLEPGGWLALGLWGGDDTEGIWERLFDPRNNVPRIGRILMARGRDACDVAIATTFGPNTLESFKVWADAAGDDDFLSAAR